MNDSSLVIEVVFNGKRALLMGDAGARVERHLIDREILPGPYEVLVAGHHGSRDTSSEEFLKQVSPAYSIVSTNANNIRGYPDAETLERLATHTRVELLATYAEGDVCLQLNAAQESLFKCNISPYQPK